MRRDASLAVLVLFLLTLVAAGTLFAGQNPYKLTPEQQARHRKLCDALLAPCCWKEAASTHASPAAEEVRAEVARQILAGQSDDEVLNSFVASFGERILIEPRGAKAAWLYLLPVIFFAGGGAMVAVALWHWVRRNRLELPSSP